MKKIHMFISGALQIGLIALLLSFLSVSFTACTDKKSSADEVMADYTADLMSEAQAQVGNPNIVNFQERKLAKMIFELRDKEDLICYAYIKNEMTGKLNYIGKCVGFGLPYSVQFTNPEYVVKNSSYGYGTLPQPDPNDAPHR